jgi:probable HAF family extracellular repeat protein
MRRTNGTDIPEKKRSAGWLPYVLGGLVVASAAVAEQSPIAAATDAAKAADPGRTTYRVINLGSGNRWGAPVINASGQVAFASRPDLDTPIRAWFYDGAAIQQIVTPGGQDPAVSGLNDPGQVVGTTADNSGNEQAFIWSKSSGFVGLGTLPGGIDSRSPAINDKGLVVGSSTFAPGAEHAFRWTLAGGIEDLGALTTDAGSLSSADSLNDDGMIAGFSRTSSGDIHPVVWSKKAGMIDIDTLGTNYSYAVAVSNNGLVAGNILAGDGHHAFTWTRAGGMRDLGATVWGTQAFVHSMSENGQVAGDSIDAFQIPHAITWTHKGGVVVLGELGGAYGSYASAANTKGQVVGLASTPDDDTHAFIWTAKHGLIDLNDRLRNAPAGLVVTLAYGIAENGAIVAGSNAGLVLLVPGRGSRCGPAVGPIAAAELVQVGAPVDASVNFVADDPAAKHNVFWSWGDGSGEQGGNTRASNGAGSGTGSHTFTKPGIYAVSAKVVDLAGNSTAVSRTIVAYDPSAGVSGGSGSVKAPRRLNRTASLVPDMATFSFVAPRTNGVSAGGPKAQLQFNVEGMSFRSKDLRPHGARGQFAGSGSINGAGNYKFAMSTTAGAGAAGRFSLRIWHLDPATQAEVVDYNSRGAGSSVAADSIVKGRIALQQ